ncbi:purine nucleoside permease [Puniceicoccaceae bacterium K14]|nr:purine nucleoside permease [Puniceicoccaceae bacterium K14]
MSDDGLMVALTGGDVTHAATTITASGIDSRFDFSDTFSIIAGTTECRPQRRFTWLSPLGEVDRRRRPPLRNRCP